MGMDRRTFLSKSVSTAAGLTAAGGLIETASAKPKSPQEKTAEAVSGQKPVSYKEAIVKKYPEQVIVTIAKDKNGKANPVTMGWTMITSGRPPMMAVSMSSGHYTVGCVRHSRCFTIAFPSAEMAEAVLFFGRNSGWNTDKFKEYGVCRNEPAKEIDSVLLTDAVANFECELAEEFVTGDHIIFVGRIVASHINTAPKRRLYIIGKGAKLGPVAPISI